MDRWTNIVESLLKNDYRQRHKSKPVELTNVAAGTLKRLKGSLRDRKQSRRTEFDSVRNLSRSDSPVQLTEAEKKLQKRKEQLIKWKQEKQQKKQMAAEQKKKPFVVGIVHPPLTFAPPPPVPRCLPSTSGRVTRSQTARNEAVKQKDPKQSNFKSFAPQNAVFHPPKLNISTYPILRLDINKDKKNPEKTNIQKVVEGLGKKTTNVKPSVTRSLTTKYSQNVTIVKSVVEPQSLRETNSNKGNMSKANDTNKKNNNLINKATLGSKNNKTSKTNIIKMTTRVNDVPKINENSKKARAIEFVIEKNKMSPKKVRNKPRRVQTPRRPVTKYQSSSDEKSDISFSSQVYETTNSSNSSQKQDDAIIHMHSVKSNLNTTHDLNVTPKNVIPKSESSSEEKLKKQCSNNSIMTPEQIRKEAERISPCVILSRGKDNARRELKQKLEEGLIDEMGNTESVHHFRQQLDSEVVRMTKMCETWDEISEKSELPESVQEQILSATGQARLLMSQKFQQFSGLVERCAAGEECVGGGLVTPTDLQGFWDMLFIQVENIDLRFIELEKLKQRGWAEDEKPKWLEKKPITNKNVKKQNKPAATSRLREMIAAARKTLKEQCNSPAFKPEEQKACFVSLPFSPSPLVQRSSSVSSKSGTPCTPSSAGRLLFSSDAQKASVRRSLASYAMLRASQISKSIEIEGISPLEQTPKNLTPINLDATPARSILKSKNHNMPERKLTKTVLFDNNGVDSDARSNSSIIEEEKIHTASTTYTYNQTNENIEVQSESRVPLKQTEITECTSIDANAQDMGKDYRETVVKRNRRKTLQRQDAFAEENADTNKIMTRQRRQSAMASADVGNAFQKSETGKKTLRSSKKKKALQEIEVNIHQSTDLERDDDILIRSKSTRRRQKVSDLEHENMIKSTPRKSKRRSKASTATGDNFDNFENIPFITPRRSSTKRDAKIAI